MDTPVLEWDGETRGGGGEGRKGKDEGTRDDGKRRKRRERVDVME